MIRLHLPLLLCACLGTARAADFSASARGTTAADFLNLGPSARAISMGEAYSSVADEATAVYWNPAALTRIEAHSAAFMHAAHLDDSYFDHAAYGQKAGERGAFGFGAQYLSAGRIPYTDIAGVEDGSFTPHDLALSAAYARRIEGLGPLHGVSVGVAAKFIQSKILETAQTFAGDVGVLSPGYLDGKLRLALTAANLGGKMKFERESEDLPMALRAGSSYKITDRWLAALDLGFPKSDEPYAAAGTEYRVVTQSEVALAARAGYNTKTLGDIDGFTGASFGAGIAYGYVTLDYGFLPFGGLGVTHRVSLSLTY